MICISSLPPVLNRESKPLSEPQLRRIEALVEVNIAETLPITRLARELGMSPSHFSHRFKAAVGITPHTFVLQRKMWKAVRLLSETNWSLEEVAGQVGFSNMRHFRRQFCKFVGCNPSDMGSGVPVESADDCVKRGYQEMISV